MGRPLRSLAAAALFLPGCATSLHAPGRAPAPARPVFFDPARAAVSAEEAVVIARTFLRAQPGAEAYETESSRVGYLASAWEVFFPLKEAERYPLETAVVVDAQTGEARLTPP